MARKPVGKPSDHDYQRLGEMLQSLYETGYTNRRVMYRMSFIKGVLAGFGGVIGATVVVGLLLWVLSLLHHVPFVHDITDNVKQSVQEGQKR